MLDISKVMPGWSIEGVLGSGDFGTVYLVRNAENGSFSAVKVIKVPPADEAISMAVQFGISCELLTTYFTKFKNDLSWELAMYGNVKCRNLAAVEDTVTVDSQGPGWTGYIRTGIYTPLATYFEKAEATPEDAARLGEDLANALDALAQYGMVHGEIKPENVMVTDGGSFVLTDFAVRRTLEKAGSGIFGTNTGDFAAPETLAEEHRYTPQSDIYSVGAMMCYVANGCSMPEHNDPMKIRNIDPSLAAIIKKAMSADPSARFQTAGQMKIELTRLGAAKKQPRRAMAAAAAFDAVKRNGGAVMTAPRTETRPAETLTPPVNVQRRTSSAAVVEEAPEVRTEDVPAGRVKKSKAGWFISAGAVAAMVAVVLLIWTPWKRDEADPDAGQHGTIYEDDQNQGGENDQNNEDNNAGQGNVEEQNGPEQNGENVQGNSGENNAEQNDNGEENNNAEQNNNNEENNGSEQNNSSEQNSGSEQNNNGENNNEQNSSGEQNNNEQNGSGEGQNENSENNSGSVRPEAVNDDILYPSDTVRMTRAELEGKTRQEVAMLINEIYARHGYIFSTTGTGTVQDYFNSQKWYTPRTSDASAVQKEFNAVETANIRTLTDYRAELNAAGGNTSSGGNTASGGDSGNEQTGGSENQGGSNGQGETGNGGNGSNEQGGSGNGSDTPAKDNTVLFPSDTKLITAEDLAGKTREEVTRVLNEIYARHGYIFKNEALKEYFEGQEWYRPVTSNQTVVYGMFNETEKANSQFLDDYMKAQGWR